MGKLALLLLACLAAGATPIRIADSFPGSTWPAPGYDVIGSRSDFDIESLWGEIGPSMTNLHIAFNFRNSTLQPFLDFGLWLGVGDLLFEVNDVVRYGVPLVSHAGSPNGGPSGQTVTAGHLYRVNNDAGVLTAREVLNDPIGLIYRPEEEVWLRDDGRGSLTDLAAGTVKAIGRGTPHAAYEVQLHFPSVAPFWNDCRESGFEFSFANATGAQDILKSNTPVPEASTYVLIGVGLLALGLLRGRAHRILVRR